MFVLTPTPVLTIRPYVVSDADALFELVDRNRPHLREWLTWVDTTHSVHDTQEFIEVSMAQFAHDDGYNAGIFVDDRLAGAIGLHYINRSNRSTEIGYWLAHAYGGRGYMTGAVRAVMNHAFAMWNLNRIEIRAARDNLRSRAIPERLGFVHEGTLRQNLNLYGVLHDLTVYAMLRADWPA